MPPTSMQRAAGFFAPKGQCDFRTGESAGRYGREGTDTILLVLLLLWLLAEALFALTHRRSLTERETQLLAQKRRRRFIRKHYRFAPAESYPTKAFKSALKQDGKFYAADLSLAEMPSFAAHLLKGKKHEWVLLAFVREDRVPFLYANKGPNNASVSILLDTQTLFEVCRKEGIQTVMRFHNHPNPDPARLTGLVPSDQDLRSARHLSGEAAGHGVNWLDFVCERGRYLEFYRAFAREFYPDAARPERIREENRDERRYYALQRELGLFRFS